MPEEHTSRDPYDDIHDYLQRLEPNSAELTRYVEDIPMHQLLEGWDGLSDDLRIKVFLHLSNEAKLDLMNSLPANHQETLLEVLSAEKIKLLLEEMEPDDLTDFIQTVNPDVRKSVWQNLSDETKKETLFLLRYDEDDAAGLMTPKYLAIRDNLTIGQALNFIRKSSGEVETVYYIYVIDHLKRLQGVISLRDVLSTEDSDGVNSIMQKKIISVTEKTDQEEVAKTLETYDLLAIPVVDSYNRLLGIVTVDDVLDVIRKEQTEDVYKMGAMEGSTDRYLETNIFKLVKKRIPWLTILLLVGTVTTNVIHHYEGIILGAAFLFIFMPIITQTGGNAGSQSSTLMIRGLATGELHFRNVGKIMLKEIFVGIILGIGTGVVILLRSFFLPPGVGFPQAITVGVSLSFVVLFATFIGAVAPLLIHKMGYDPTVMSAPLMATLIDVAGLTIYFETAKLLLGL
jgi:magnesium transporter